MSEKIEKEPSIWEHYNPKLYLKKFVNWQERDKPDPYERKPLYIKGKVKTKSPFLVIREEFNNLMRP